MALALLLIMTMVLGILSLMVMGILIFGKENFVKRKIILYPTLILNILVSYIAITALPSNYVLEITIASILGFAGILGFYIARFKEENLKLSKILIIISLIGNFYIRLLK